jgi:hypothetical protein
METSSYTQRFCVVCVCHSGLQVTTILFPLGNPGEPDHEHAFRCSVAAAATSATEQEWHEMKIIKHHQVLLCQ